MKDPLNLIWIDLEMTGLSPEKDRIIEIATVVTDKDLNILGEGPVYAISQTQAMLDGMDEWNTRQHGKSGLTGRVQNSTITEVEAETKTIEILELKRGTHGAVLDEHIDWAVSRLRNQASESERDNA